MTDVTKLIEELETWNPNTTGLLPFELIKRAADALRVLTTPKDGVGEGEIPYKVIAELYTSTLQQWLPPAKGMPPMRKRMIAQRWQEDKERQSIGWWADYWIKVSCSDFLTGRGFRREGHTNWRPSFDWFIKPSNLMKVIEGSYDNRDARTDTDRITNFR